MAELYGSSGQQVTTLLELAEGSKKRGWWQAYASTARRNGFDTYLGLETAAEAVSTFGADPLPELLQTEEYCSALLATERETITEDEISERLTITATRQQRLLGEHPLELYSVLDESALRRGVGGPRVMRAQLEHLVLMSYRRNVTLRVLPFGSGAHPLLGDRVTAFSFRETGDPQVVHVGDSTNSRFWEKPAETAPYLAALERVCALALPPKESTMLISSIADEHRE